MVRLSLSQLPIAAGTLTLLLTAGAGVASADPDLSPAINTTCSYSQVVAALNAQSPLAAAELNESPTAQAALRGFLDSSPDQRRQIADELESEPDTRLYVNQYGGFVVQVANTCNNY
jgi:hemophore-related protein